MEISKEEILVKTHYGLTIYAHVLRSYYKNATVLHLSGKECKPAKNPFSKNQYTLMVSIKGKKAIHFDTEKSIPDGDAFDFAKLHYNKDGQELLNTLNEEMHLNIGQKKEIIRNETMIDFFKPMPKELKKITQLPVCSFFTQPITNTTPTKTLTLIDIYYLIKEPLYQSTTTALRAINDKKLAREYKANNFDYVTFSGVFSKRNDKDLLSHSGLLTIDFDHVPDINSLKVLLLNDPYFDTELMFISPSGDGLKWIIPIEITQAKHQDYFKSVSNYILHEYKLEIDKSGKDTSRACFLPFDPSVIINAKYLDNE